MNLEAIQAAVREARFDGWLFYDHHHRDPIGERILGLDPKAHITRRWYYFVPAVGEPRKLVHRVEQGRLDTLPGTKGLYSSWQELAAGLEAMPWRCEKDRHAVLTEQRDHVTSRWRTRGRLNFCAGLGKLIVSSADLVSQFEAVLSVEQMASHAAAQQALDEILAECWKEIGRRLRPRNGRNGGVSEFDMVAWLRNAMHREGLVWETGPNVSVERKQAPTRTMSRSQSDANRFRTETFCSSTSGLDLIRREASFTTLPGRAWWGASRPCGSNSCSRRSAMRRDAAIARIKNAFA